MRQRESQPLAAGIEVGGTGSKHLHQVVLPAAKRCDRETPVRRHDPAVDRGREDIRLVDQCCRRAQVAPKDLDSDAGYERQRQLGDGADLSRRANLLRGERVPAFVVPYEAGCPPGNPQPSQRILAADPIPLKGVDSALQDGLPGGMAVCDQHCQAFKKQVHWPGLGRQWRRVTDRPGHSLRVVLASQPAGEQGGRQGIEGDLARSPGIEGFESFRGGEQQHRRVAASLGGEQDPSP